jgi:hypothetical protein
LCQLNGNPIIKKLVKDAIDPRNFIGTDFNLNDAVNYLNTFLEYDGYKLFKIKNRYLVCSITEPIVPVDVKIIGSSGKLVPNDVKRADIDYNTSY